MGKIIGYARVSTNEQNLNLQVDALKKEGCIKRHIYVDKASGAKADRPGLDACLAALEPGAVLLVWRLDRLGRSMSHLVKLIEQLLENKIGFKSICDGTIDTTTASGEFVFNIFSALAQFERRLIQERTKAGLNAARARGKKGGRKAITANDPRVVTAKEMHKNKTINIQKICSTLNISRATFYRYLTIQD